jgi:cathepsin X
VFTHVVSKTDKAELLSADQTVRILHNPRYGRYFVSEFGVMTNPSKFEIKAEVYQRGPISCAIDATTLESGNYRHGRIVTNNYTFSITNISTISPKWDLDHNVVISGNDDDDGDDFFVFR